MESSSQILHHNVVMAVADEEHDVLSEHGLEEPDSPCVREVGATQIVIGDNEVRDIPVHCTMYVHDSREVTAER